MSRRCTLCPRSGMPDDVRHLHELEPGVTFQLEHGGEVFRVSYHADAATFIQPVVTRKIKRTITPRFGDPREFETEDRSLRRCAPGAQVIPT